MSWARVASPVLLDNDVVWKLCCFRCEDVLSRLGTAPPAMLNVGKYTLRDKVRRTTRVRDRQRVVAALEGALATLSMLQPDAAELALATDLEDAAARLSLDFDSGESQLLAELITRSWPLLITGDKRAIAAIDKVLPGRADGRIACLEQLMATIISLKDVGEVRAGVCGEPAVDRALTNCFACASQTFDVASLAAGLTSYIDDVRRTSGRTLINQKNLTAMV